MKDARLRKFRGLISTILSRKAFSTITGRGEAIPLVLLFILPLAFYWPGLYGDFFLDDYPHIVHNNAIQINHLTLDKLWAASNSTSSGPLGRPLALTSFALNYYFSALNPYYFKLTNLLLHAFTGIGVFYLVRRIATWLNAPEAATGIATLTALLWLSHPQNVSTVLYAVQRMTILATLLIVWGMVAYCYGREQVLRNSRKGWWWIALGLLTGSIGLFAKETAVLMLGYLLVIEWKALRFNAPTITIQKILIGSYIIAVGLPLLWLITKLLSPDWITRAYALRSFTLSERLLTECRVLWDYLSLTLLPNIQSMGLYHDGYRISHSLLDPPITAVALAGHILLIGIAWKLRRIWPIFTFAVAWFYVGHSAESTVLPLEIKYEHRNYLPMLGILLAVIHGVYFLTARLKNTTQMRIIMLTCLVFGFGSSTAIRAAQFGDFWGFSTMEAEHHPESSRANQHAAVSMIKLMMQSKEAPQQLIKQTTDYLYRSANTNPNTTAPLFAAVLFLPELTGHPPPQYFMEELTTRLSQAIPDANINVYFTALLHQAQDGKLVMSASEVHYLCNSAERNPHISRGIKAEIITTEAIYTFSVENDAYRAREIIDRALKTDPLRIGIYVPAIWIYQEIGMWQDAELLLAQLKKLDIYGLNRNSIEMFSKRTNP